MVVTASRTARLFGEEGKGLRLIQHAQFAFGLVERPGIEIDATLDEVPVKVGDQSARVPRCHAPVAAIREKGRDGGVSIADARIVDAVHPLFFRKLHVGMREEKLSNGRVKSESIDTSPGGVHQHGRAPVQHIASGDECTRRLQEVRC